MLPTAKIVTVILVFAAASDVKTEKEKSAGFIQNLISTNINVLDSKRRFLLQKFHTVPYEFEGLGFFHVNYETLVGVNKNSISISA